MTKRKIELFPEAEPPHTLAYKVVCLLPEVVFIVFLPKKKSWGVSVFFFLNEKSCWATDTYLMQEDRKTCFKHAILTLPLATHILFPLHNSNIP